MEVVIGVDPHKATKAAVAIDEHRELVGQAAFPANRGGIRALERRAKRFAERRWAIFEELKYSGCPLSHVTDSPSAKK